MTDGTVRAGAVVKFPTARDAQRPVANYGRVLSVFGVFALFTLMLAEIRYSYHPDHLQGPMGDVEVRTQNDDFHIQAGIILGDRISHALLD